MCGDVLSFTPAGAVQTPTTLQIRWQPSFAQRVEAGAPSPTRVLEADEVLANIRHFTLDRVNPRTRPINALVLSAFDPTTADFKRIIHAARQWGVARITGHLTPQQVDRVSHGLDAIAVRVRTAADVRRVILHHDRHTTVVVLLDRDTEQRAGPLASALAQSAPDRIVFTWPFPPAEPLFAARATQLLDRLVSHLPPHVEWGLKGLTACQAPLHRDRVWRTSNRFYVDSDHQGDNALLLIPHLVDFTKPDSCRYCRRNPSCDGVPRTRWMSAYCGPLHPIR